MIEIAINDFKVMLNLYEIFEKNPWSMAVTDRSKIRDKNTVVMSYWVGEKRDIVSPFSISLKSSK